MDTGWAPGKPDLQQQYKHNKQHLFMTNPPNYNLLYYLALWLALNQVNYNPKIKFLPRFYHSAQFKEGLLFISTMKRSIRFIESYLPFFTIAQHCQW